MFLCVCAAVSESAFNFGSLSFSKHVFLEQRTKYSDACDRLQSKLSCFMGQQPGAQTKMEVQTKAQNYETLGKKTVRKHLNTLQWELIKDRLGKELQEEKVILILTQNSS